MLKVGLRTVDSHEVEEVDALLDSGATGLFIDCVWLHQKKITTCKLEHPIEVYNRVIHSNHFWAIFSSFSISFLISFLKNGVQNEMKMNQKMTIFEKLNPSLAFVKMIIFTFIFPFHFCCSVKLCSDAQSFQWHHHQWRHPSPSHLYTSTTTTTTPSPPAVTAPMPPPMPARTASGCKWPASDAMQAQMTTTCCLGSRVCLFFVCFFFL